MKDTISFLSKFLVASFLIVTVTACGGGAGGSDVLKPTMTIQQANQQLEEHIQRTRAAFPAEATFEKFSSYTDSPCEDPGDPGPKGQQFATRIYQIKHIAPDKIQNQFDNLEKWWKRHGYKIADRDHDSLRAESTEDGFMLSLRTNDKKELFLFGDSICVWPNGTPEPDE